MARTRLIRKIPNIRARVEDVRRRGGTVGLVPTMGALHAGHFALIERARADCHRVAVSLFVNATQFNSEADLQRYPRTLDSDLECCLEHGVDWLFAPSAKEMYPQKGMAQVNVAELTDGLCGATRPGHFQAVTTVVAKLFHIIPANRAYFGEKDFQQLTAIRRVVDDLNFAIEIVPVATVREEDGLALSSRNQRLNEAGRAAATVFPRALRAAVDLFEEGETAVEQLKAVALVELESEPLVQIEYLEIVDSSSLKALKRVDRPARIVAAVLIEDVRLIDNMALGQ